MYSNDKEDKNLQYRRSLPLRKKALSLSVSTELKRSQICENRSSSILTSNKSMLECQGVKIQTNVRRARSAKSSAAQIFTVFKNSARMQSASSQIKWIGVHKASEEAADKAKAFPLRKQRTTDQSFANFVYKYGRQFKAAKQSKEPLVLNCLGDSWMGNSATIKVKPRLTWYESRKSDGRKDQLFKKRSSTFTVNWKSYKNEE